MVDASLYPEAAGRGLRAALADAAHYQGIDIGEIVAEPGEYGFFAVTISYGPRRVAVDVGAHRRAFIVNVSDGESVYANGTTADLSDVARVADTWRRGVSLRELNNQFPFMTYTRLAEAFERGNPIEVQWSELLDASDLSEIHPLLRAIRADRRLAHLFPTITHYTLVRLHLDPVDRRAGQLRIAVTSHGYEIASTWQQTPRVVATVTEALESAVALLPHSA